MQAAQNLEGTEARQVEDYLRYVDYSPDPDYVPSTFALEFVNFIKLVNGVEGEEHETPVVHYRMLDELVSSDKHICNMCSRGLAKTTLLGEYLFLYIANCLLTDFINLLFPTSQILTYIPRVKLYQDTKHNVQKAQCH